MNENGDLERARRAALREFAIAQRTEAWEIIALGDSASSRLVRYWNIFWGLVGPALIILAALLILRPMGHEVRFGCSGHVANMTQTADLTALAGRQRITLVGRTHNTQKRRANSFEAAI